MIKPLFIYWEKDKVGFIDQQGKIIIPAVYAEADDFSEGLAAVRKDGYFGYINTSGALVIPAKYDYATSFHEGMALVYEGERPIFINPKGEFQFESPFESASSFLHGLAKVRGQQGKYGIINKSGKLLADTIYQRITAYSNNLFLFYNDNHDIEKMAQFKDDTFHTVIGYCDILPLQDGYLLARKADNNKISVLFDSTFHVYLHASDISMCIEHAAPTRIISKKYSGDHRIYIQITDYQDKPFFRDTSTASVIRYLGANRYFVKNYNHDKGIIINQFGQFLDSIYDASSELFYQGVAVVQKNPFEESQLVDTSLKPVGKINGSVDDTWSLAEGFVVFYNNGHRGIADLNGHVIMKAGLDQDSRIVLRDGLFLTTLKDKPLYINQQGKVIWAMQADTIKRPLNVSSKNYGTFAVSSEPPHENSPRYRFFKYELPMPAPIQPTQKFAPGKIQVIVNTDSVMGYNSSTLGYQVWLANTTDTLTTFHVQDGRLYMVVQAYQDNEWTDIEYLPSSWCGNSYGTEELKPQKYWSLVCPQYTGAIKTNLRIRLSSGDEHGFTVYSNVFKGSINPGQLWRTTRYVSSNIMDPY
ncbi:WG repeat-containing protein [Chitinophaga sp. Hz27]|uniref:WG repeat-containing protein n=1 Tax=Chitinophaga sp. Hz27 TaxID=3347169 RepID=UPI0035DAECBD